MKMTNRRNIFIYRFWAPIYDSTVNLLFRQGRLRAMQMLDLQPGERVIIPGVGTGADLPLLPAGVQAVGIDLSSDMLDKARLKLPLCQATVRLIQGDAPSFVAERAAFDAAILNLILSVIPDGNALLRSTLGALKPGGRVVIFDKFLPEGINASGLRKFLNLFSTLLGTDINRRLSDLMRDCPCILTREEASLAGGMYRVILLEKRETMGD